MLRRIKQVANSKFGTGVYKMTCDAGAFSMELAVADHTYVAETNEAPYLYGLGISLPDRRPELLFKLVFDVAIAMLALLFLLPVFVVIAAAVSMDGGPVFYAHPRIGRGGRTFRCLKFRSMKVDADKLLADLLANDPAEALEWAVNRKLRNDPRVTAVGRFLRRSSLDELPQLINILRTEMSLVGPRPIVQQELPRYGASVSKYYEFRPGLTGLWQVSGRSDTSFSERVRFDALYADSWSLGADFLIIAKTIPAVFGGAGAR